MKRRTNAAPVSFVWQPILVWDSDRTAERAVQYTYLNQFSEDETRIARLKIMLMSRNQ